MKVIFLHSLKMVLGVLLIIFLALGVLNFFNNVPNARYDSLVTSFLIYSLILLGYSISVVVTGWLGRYIRPVGAILLSIEIIVGVVFAFMSLIENKLLAAMFAVIVLSDAFILFSRRSDSTVYK